VRPTVLLFDIDGTLISTGGVGRRALRATFERRYGAPDALSFPFDGMTDHAIVGQGLEKLGLHTRDEEMAATLAAYLEVLHELASEATTFRVHEGVEAALDATAGRSNIAVGLGTGNVVDGARIKLERVGLYHRFRFGGFGSDHVLRPELIRVGAERGAALLGVPRTQCRVVIIGDTPKDISAATAIGAESFAVATGSFSTEVLASHGATRVFASLAEPGVVDALLGG
jgi:phosphoglycolate phosphatase-like HAD superfamily hydrolase